MEPSPPSSRSRYIRIGVVSAMFVALVAFTLISARGRGLPTARSQTFFSTDDGKTWFADDDEKVPPFDKDGKQAVRAFVYRCGDGTMFVNHLQRFTPEAKRILETQRKSQRNRKGGPDTSEIGGALSNGREVKRPGDTKWITSDDFRAVAQVLSVKCPPGCTEAVSVEP